MSPPIPAMPSVGCAPPIASLACELASCIFLKSPIRVSLPSSASLVRPYARTGLRARSPALQAHLLGQDLPHDLVGPAPDRAQAGVAGGALDPVLLHVARAAEDLERFVSHLEQGALGGELGHRHLADRVLPVHEQAQPVVGHVAAGLVLDRHLGDLVPGYLEAAD